MTDMIVSHSFKQKSFPVDDDDEPEEEAEKDEEKNDKVRKEDGVTEDTVS
jgi:hypothetical protein